MKRLLTLSVAAFALTAATAAHATSDMTSSATTVKTTTTKTTTTNVFPASIAFPATAHEYLLKDGTFLVVDGTTAWTVDSTAAAKISAEDGDHILADDKVITTKHGYVVGGVPEIGTLVPGATAVVTGEMVKVPVPATTTSITTTTPATSETTTTTTQTP